MRSGFFAMLGACLAAQLAGCAAETRPHEPVSPVLRWSADPSAPAAAWVELGGFSQEALQEVAANELLSVYVGTPTTGPIYLVQPLPSVLGDYRIEDGVLRFKPRFPLEPGIVYRAMYWDHRQDAPLVMKVASYEIPYVARPAASVTRVYPTADVLPENLLKFYVHFSAPMSRGGVYEHIRLLDAEGRPIELPFLELGEELWDPPMTRLTLFIDPGRIKRGVRPLEEIGPALEEGRSFTLVIAPTLHDAGGRALAAEFRKPFRVGPPDRAPPDPARWTVTAPRAGTRDPLTLAFGKPLDHALAERVLRVVDASAHALDGEVSMEDHERRWLFTPAAPWTAGRYEVVVQRTLEDLAGNNIGKPFEVDMQQTTQPAETAAVRVGFEVR